MVLNHAPICPQLHCQNPAVHMDFHVREFPIMAHCLLASVQHPGTTAKTLHFEFQQDLLPINDLEHNDYVHQ